MEVSQTTLAPLLPSRSQDPSGQELNVFFKELYQSPPDDIILPQTSDEAMTPDPDDDGLSPPTNEYQTNEPKPDDAGLPAPLQQETPKE